MATQTFSSSLLGWDTLRLGDQTPPQAPLSAKQRVACCIYWSCVCFCSHGYLVSTINGVKQKQKAAESDLMWSHCHMTKTCHTQTAHVCAFLTLEGTMVATMVSPRALVGPNNNLCFKCLMLKFMKKLHDEELIRKCIPHRDSIYGSLSWSFLLCAQLFNTFFWGAVSQEGLHLVPKVPVTPLLQTVGLLPCFTA